MTKAGQVSDDMPGKRKVSISDFALAMRLCARRDCLEQKPISRQGAKNAKIHKEYFHLNVDFES